MARFPARLIRHHPGFTKVRILELLANKLCRIEQNASGGRISLNLGYAEISDPKGMCKDVSGVGRWGNGDVEVALDSIDDLPYVIGLVRQSFEKQMGSPADG